MSKSINNNNATYLDDNNILDIFLTWKGGNLINMKGYFDKAQPDNNVVYISGADPIDSMASYHGSGMPYPNKEFAYTHKTNVKTVKLNETLNGFDTNFLIPNSYYTDALGTIEEPVIDISFTIDGNHIVKKVHLNAVPHKETMWNINRKSSDFYHVGWRQPVRTQEEILYARGMPDQKVHQYSDLSAKIRQQQMKDDKNGVAFWKMRPPR